jgi:hypothetical protein
MHLGDFTAGREHTFVTEKFYACSLLEACSFERLQQVAKLFFPACIAARSCTQGDSQRKGLLFPSFVSAPSCGKYALA